MYEPIHSLSAKSNRQHRNVFIWCTNSRRLALGWRVGDDSTVTVSAAYRWVSSAVGYHYPDWEETESYTLCPVEIRPHDVLTYSVHKNGAVLSRESQEIIAPGDYGLYSIGDARLYSSFFQEVPSFSDIEEAVKFHSPELFAKASLTPALVQRVVNRDQQCLFSGTNDSDNLVATWIFPPFLGYKLSDDKWLEHKYYTNPDACDLNGLTVVENVILGRKDVVALFLENKLGIDVDDNYRIVIFEGSDRLNGGVPLKSHLILDGPDRPSDQFLRLHFNECIAVSVCLGDALEDYEDQEIDVFMESLGVYDGEINYNDPQWSSRLGQLVHAYLVRQKLEWI